MALGGLVTGCEADVGTQPTRFLPAWERVAESESYRELERFRRHPHLLDLMDRVREEVVPLAPSSDRMVVTPATVYAEDGDAFRRLVQEVLIEDRPIEDARDRLNERLRGSRRLAGRIEG